MGELHSAAINGDLGKVEKLIKRGVDVNARDEYGNTPLHYAVSSLAAAFGYLDIVRLLVDSGADINAKGEADCTPLHYAAKEGNIGVVRLLVEKGADINAKNKDGWKPLDFAREKRHQQVVEFLESVMRVYVGGSGFVVGEWGVLKVVSGGRVRVSLEGEVDWLDPGEVKGEAEIPVKPRRPGRIPIAVVAKGSNREDRRLLWIEVSEGRTPLEQGRPTVKPESESLERPTVERDFERLVSIYVGRKVGLVLGAREPQLLQRRIAAGGYECRSYLRLGGFCATLLAVDERGVSHVLKIPMDHYEYLVHGGAGSSLRLSEAQLRELAKERKALEVISRLKHPCIVEFRGVIDPSRGGPLALVFEYCEGGSLRDALAQGPLGPRLAAEVVVQIADALRRIHELGWPHGDVKPENILFTRDRIPKLADFGTARAIASTTSRPVPFTPGYAAPEHIREGRPEPKSDVWSLALVLYEAAVGRSLLPLDQIEYRDEVERLERGGTLKVHTGDGELDEVIRRCLSVNPEKRPPMRELERMLLEYLDKEAGGTHYFSGNRKTALGGDVYTSTPSQPIVQTQAAEDLESLVAKYEISNYDEFHFGFSGPKAKRLYLETMKVIEDVENKKINLEELLKYERDRKRDPSIYLPLILAEIWFNPSPACYDKVTGSEAEKLDLVNHILIYGGGQPEVKKDPKIIEWCKELYRRMTGGELKIKEI